MNYRRNNKNNTKIVIVAVFLIVIVFVVYLHKPIFYKISSTVSFVSTPLMKAGKGIGNVASPVFVFFTSKQKLKEENDRLKNELEIYTLASISNKLLMEENQLLKKIMGRSEEKEFVLAAVLSKPNHSLYDTLILDVGDKNGIRKNDLVLFENEFAIGTITEVHGRSSKATLFSNPGNIMKVWIGPLGIPAEAKGKGGGNFEITLPRDIIIKEGDIVAVPEMNIDILGVVGYIKKDPTDSFQTILFRTPVNISELKWVQVVGSYSSDTSNE